MPGSSAIDTLLTGDVIAGRFRLVRMLGRGGFGAVYEAEQISMQRRIALKIIQRDVGSEDENTVERFNFEARQTSRLRHHNTVIIHDFGVDEAHGILFLAMEYLEGKDLKALLRSEGALDYATTLHILEQIAASLEEAHELGLVHRDLKPANVMLTQRGDDPYHVKVIDFGIAKAVGAAEGGRRLTKAGVLLGTPYYMAPEQIGPGEIDHRVDVYACAVMTFQMLSGHVPFKGANPLEVLKCHALEPPPDLFDVAPETDAPVAVGAWLRGAMAKDPDARPESMRAFIAGLRRAGSVDDDTTMKASSPDLVEPAVRVGAAPLVSHVRPTESALDPAEKTRADASGPVEDIERSAATIAVETVRPDDPATDRRLLWIGIAALLVLVAVAGVWLTFSARTDDSGTSASSDESTAPRASSDGQAQPATALTASSPSDAPRDVPRGAPSMANGSAPAATSGSSPSTPTPAEGVHPAPAHEPAPERTDDRQPNSEPSPESGADDDPASAGKSAADTDDAESASDDSNPDEVTASPSSADEEQRPTKRSRGDERVECTLVARPWGEIHYRGKALSQRDVRATMSARRGREYEVELVQNGVAVASRSFSVPRSGRCKVTVRAPR